MRHLKIIGKEVISRDKLETDDIIQLVSGKKTEFGDLDIDLVFKADKKDIAKAIEQIDPSSFATRVRPVKFMWL